MEPCLHGRQCGRVRGELLTSIVSIVWQWNLKQDWLRIGMRTTPSRDSRLMMVMETKPQRHTHTRERDRVLFTIYNLFGVADRCGGSPLQEGGPDGVFPLLGDHNLQPPREGLLQGTGKESLAAS